jgi:hypothetical protein
VHVPGRVEILSGAVPAALEPPLVVKHHQLVVRNPLHPIACSPHLLSQFGHHDLLFFLCLDFLKQIENAIPYGCRIIKKT